MSRSPQRSLDAPPSPILGVVVAIAAVAATTLIVFLVREVAPTASSGVVYLLPVLLVSSYWGLWLGLPTAFASALAFSFFHIAPTGRLTVAEPENWVALGVYLATAAVVSTMADLARSRAREAEGRRQEADLAAAMARILLGGADLRTALPAASRRLAEALDLPGAEIVLDGGGGRPAVPLHLGAGRSGALVLPAGSDPGVAARAREHVVPALEALLRAALDRDALQAEVVETAALRRSDVLKTALLRAVSHDLRSPLTARSSARWWSRRRLASRGWWRTCSTSPGSSPAPPCRGATGARSRRSFATRPMRRRPRRSSWSWTATSRSCRRTRPSSSECS